MMEYTRRLFTRIVPTIRNIGLWGERIQKAFADMGIIELADGRTCGVDALYLGPRTRLNSDIAEALGCEMEEGPFGQIIRTDPQKMTTVPHVYAAGDITRGAHNVTWATADGVTAGLAVHRSLIF